MTFKVASHTRLLWGLQSSLNLQCSSEHGSGIGGEDAEEEHWELWGFPLTAPRVKYVSTYNLPFAEFNRTLTPISGYDAGVYSFTTIDISDKITNPTGSAGYVGGVLGPDGKVVFVPRHVHNIGIFDPSDRNFTTIDISDKISSLKKYYGGVLGPDGKVVFVPDNAHNIGMFDPSDKSFATIDISDKIYSGAKYLGGVLGPDGKVVFVPVGPVPIGILELGNQDLAYEVSGGIPQAWSSLLSPHFNKF